MKISKPTRQFVDQNLVVDSWESIEKYFTDLINREINTKEDFLTWLKDQSELEAILEEDAAWRYIKMTIDTKNEERPSGGTKIIVFEPGFHGESNGGGFGASHETADM